MVPRFEPTTIQVGSFWCQLRLLLVHSSKLLSNPRGQDSREAQLFSNAVCSHENNIFFRQQVQDGQGWVECIRQPLQEEGVRPHLRRRSFQRKTWKFLVTHFVLTGKFVSPQVHVHESNSAVDYKPRGRGFESHWLPGFFSIYRLSNVPFHWSLEVVQHSWFFVEKTSANIIDQLSCSFSFSVVKIESQRWFAHDKVLGSNTASPSRLNVVLSLSARLGGHVAVGAQLLHGPAKARLLPRADQGWSRWALLRCQVPNLLVQWVWFFDQSLEERVYKDLV